MLSRICLSSCRDGIGVVAVVRCDGSVLCDHGHASFLHTCTDTSDELTNDFIFSRDNLGWIYLLWRTGDAILSGALHCLPNLSRVKKRLRRDTPFVKADATERPLLNEQRLQSSTSSTLSSCVARGSSTDDDKIVCHNSWKSLVK